MKEKILIISLVLISNICFAQNTKKVKQIDSLFTMLYEQNQFNGSVLIAENNKVIYNSGKGIRDENTKQKNNSNTIFELASVSKQFTATAIILLNREGKLKYSDDFTKYIPELSFWKDITIADLLRHTSGIPEFLLDMKDEWDENKIATNQNMIEFYASRKDTLEFIPKSKHSYSNTNYALLASIIERVSGVSYSEFLERNIFKPLKMKRTFVYNRRQNPKKLNNYAIGYYWAENSFNKVTAEEPGHDDKRSYYLDGIVGNAKVHSSTKDLFKWVNALKSNSFLTQEEFEEMTRITETSEGKKISYGFGLEISRGENKFAYGHSGRTDGYITFLYHDQIKNRIIIILENFDLGTYPFENIIEILEDKPLTERFNKKIILTDNELEKFVGEYEDITDETEKHLITFKNGHLIYNTPDLPWDLRFFPISKNEFQGLLIGGMDAKMKFINEGGKLKVELSQYGNIIGEGVKK